MKRWISCLNTFAVCPRSSASFMRLTAVWPRHRFFCRTVLSWATAERCPMTALSASAKSCLNSRMTPGYLRRLSGYAAELGARRKEREPRKRPCGHGLLRRSCCGIKKYDDRRNLGTEHSKHTQSDPEIRSVNFRLLRRKKSFCFLKEGFCLANIKTVSTITVAESGEFVLINCQDRK